MVIFPIVMRSSCILVENLLQNELRSGFGSTDRTQELITFLREVLQMQQE